MTFLYSVNSWLSYKIAEHFYANHHFVWCSPVFNAKGINPPSSDPYEICNGLIKDIEGRDKHSAKISYNKTGILKGADIQHGKGVITSAQRLDIIEMVNIAELEDFRPLVFVIPYDKVQAMTQPASVKLTAGLFSKEFIIEKLPRDKFDVLDIFKNNRHV